MKKRDYYEVLGVDRQADEGAIKKAKTYLRDHGVEVREPVLL